MNSTARMITNFKIATSLNPIDLDEIEWLLRNIPAFNLTNILEYQENFSKTRRGPRIFQWNTIDFQGNKFIKGVEFLIADERKINTINGEFYYWEATKSFIIISNHLLLIGQPIYRLLRKHRGLRSYDEDFFTIEHLRDRELPHLRDFVSNNRLIEELLRFYNVWEDSKKTSLFLDEIQRDWFGLGELKRSEYSLEGEDHYTFEKEKKRVLKRLTFQSYLDVFNFKLTWAFYLSGSINFFKSRLKEREFLNIIATFSNSIGEELAYRYKNVRRRDYF